MLHLMRVLATVSSPCLARLVLHINAFPVSTAGTASPSADTPSVLALHGVLQKPVFDSLQAVSVIVYHREDPEVCATLVIWLSPWMVRGIMQVVWGDEPSSSPRERDADDLDKISMRVCCG